jgi:membrane-anchored glycerophosphoryl diester phosphodiesterase (GDPDase)
MAATLGLLQASFAKPRWLVAAQSVRRHSGQLLGVQVLITLIAMLLMVPFGLAFFLVKFFGGFGLIFFMMGELVFLILLKYALASPFVVVENLTATSALVVSWTMTRHRFGFVLGCYLLAGVVDGSIRAVTTLISAPTYLSGVISLPLLVISTYWYVLPWVMYLCIREAEQEPLPASVY